MAKVFPRLLNGLTAQLPAMKVNPYRRLLNSLGELDSQIEALENSILREDEVEANQAIDDKWNLEATRISVETALVNIKISRQNMIVTSLIAGIVAVSGIAQVAISWADFKWQYVNRTKDNLEIQKLVQEIELLQHEINSKAARER